MTPTTPYRRLLQLLLSAVALSAPLMVTAPAHAQESDEFSSELSQEAVEHYRRGMEHYQAGEYEQTIVELLEAYSLTPDAMLLYNVSLAHWKSGDVESARRSALRARADGLPEQVSVRNEARLHAFTTILGAEQIAGSSASETSTVAPDAQPSQPPADAGISARAEGGVAEEDSRGGIGALGWTGLASVTTGALALGGAAVINGQLAEDAAPLREAVEEGDAAAVQQFREDELERLQRKQRTGQVLLIGGALLGTMGTTFLVVDLLGTDRSTTARASGDPGHLTPVEWSVGLAPGGGTVVLRAHF